MTSGSRLTRWARSSQAGQSSCCLRGSSSRPATLALADGRVIDMARGDHALLELVRQAADGAPEAFVSTLFPYMLRVMDVASVGEHVPLGDWHFGSRIINSHISELDDALLYAMQAALAKVAADAPDRLRALIEPLAADPHQGAQSLLYEALIAAGPAHAGLAGDLLLRGGPALESGYSDDYRWTTRQLIQATASYMSDDRYERLEGLLLAYAPDYERWTELARTRRLHAALGDAGGSPAPNEDRASWRSFAVSLGATNPRLREESSEEWWALR